MDVKQLPADFENWMPIRVFWQDNRPFVDWCYMDRDRFVQPFFDITIQRRMHDPFSLVFKFQLPADELAELNTIRPGMQPTGFVFHMSRCGSTLISQMLASLPQNIVISEASPIDSLLRSNTIDPSISDETRIGWLRSIIEAFGRKRSSGEKHYFIKFDSWHTLYLDLIYRAFPEVPWIFLYRDPAEVIVSHMRQSGAQMVPGAMGHLLPGLDIFESAKMPREEYCALVLKHICESALDQMNKNGSRALLVNYDQLPEVVTSTILQHFGVACSEEEVDKMNAAAKFDAKNPQANFVADREEKKNEANEAVISAAGGMAPVYEKLESFRNLSAPAKGQG
jgi:gluconate kinase